MRASPLLFRRQHGCFCLFPPVIEAIQETGRSLAFLYAFLSARAAAPLVPKRLRVSGGSAARARCAAS